MDKAIVNGARGVRVELALTINEMAVKTKTSIQTVKTIEKGGIVKLSTARKYAKALRLPASVVEIVG